MLKHLIAVGLIVTHAQLAAAPPAGPRGSATIEWQRDARPHVVLDDVAWSCNGNGCAGALGSDAPRAVARYCRILARYGRVTSFSTPAGPLGEAELLRCNGQHAS